MKQVTAAREMLKSLEIGPEHASLKEMVLGLAKSVDKEPTNAALWRELRAAVTTLREATSNSNDDETQAFLFSIRTPRPPLGDS